MNIFALQTTSFLPAASVAGPAAWFEADAAVAAGEDYFVDVSDPVAKSGTLAALVRASPCPLFRPDDRRVTARLAQQVPMTVSGDSSLRSAQIYLGGAIAPSAPGEAFRSPPADFAEDVSLLRRALEVHFDWTKLNEESVVIEKSLAWGTHRLALAREDGPHLEEDAAWRRICRALIFYFGTVAEEGEEEALRWAQQLTAAYFARMGWPYRAPGARARLLQTGREWLLLRYGERLPPNPRIEGVPLQLGERASLSRWLKGEPIVFNSHLPAKEFYRQIRAYLSGMGIASEEVEALMEAAIFEQKGWPVEADTARARLLLAGRKAVARLFGGQLSFKTGIDGIPTQEARKILYRWIGGEAVQFNPSVPPYRLYQQVRRLLEAAGHDTEEIDRFIEEAVFEEEGWLFKGDTPDEALLLAARKAVARRFGGRLPLAIEGSTLPNQMEKNALSRWLAGKPVLFSQRFPPRKFYGQVIQLLEVVGTSREEIRLLILNKVFEAEGWDGDGDPAATAQNRLLLAAREAVALKLGGGLTDRGVAHPRRSELTVMKRWLAGGKIVFNKKLPPREFYGQVKNLLVRLGVEEAKADALIIDAVFEGEGWERIAKTAREELLLEARRAAAVRFGGRLPRGKFSPGILVQKRDSPLSLWLAEGKVHFNTCLQPHGFFFQVRSLLKELGVDPDRVRLLIVNAVFEERGWEKNGENDRKSLLKFFREWAAFVYGGKLPQYLLAKGIPRQRPDGFLSRWLRGEAELETEEQRNQIKALLGSEGGHDVDAMFRQDRVEKIRTAWAKVLSRRK